MIRLFHRLYARLLGYSWLNCDMCGHGFGTHEAYAIMLPDKNRTGRYVCKNCLPYNDYMYDDDNIVSRTVPPPDGWDSW